MEIFEETLERTYSYQVSAVALYKPNLQDETWIAALIKPECGSREVQYSFR